MYDICHMLYRWRHLVLSGVLGHVDVLHTCSCAAHACTCIQCKHLYERKRMVNAGRRLGVARRVVEELGVQLCVVSMYVYALYVACR